MEKFGKEFSVIFSEPATSKGVAYWVRHYDVLRVSIYSLSIA